MWPNPRTSPASLLPGARLPSDAEGFAMRMFPVLSCDNTPLRWECCGTGLTAEE